MCGFNGRMMDGREEGGILVQGQYSTKVSRREVTCEPCTICNSTTIAPSTTRLGDDDGEKEDIGRDLLVLDCKSQDGLVSLNLSLLIILIMTLNPSSPFTPPLPVTLPASGNTPLRCLIKMGLLPRTAPSPHRRTGRTTPVVQCST